MDFACMADSPSINTFLKNKEKISKTSFLHYYHKSGLAEYKKQGAFDASIAKMMLTNYFEKTMQSCKDRMAVAQDSCHYLTANEEHSLVQMCTVLGFMGYGLTCHDLHELSETVVNKDIDERLHLPISIHVTDGLLQRNKELVKIVAASSLDPKRAGQATSATRYAMFSKLNSYIQLLFAMGEVPWRMYNDILPDSIYNMDKTGNDTTKHRNKIISKKKDSWTKEAKTTRTFMRTSEGDGCMPWHITICLTTRADDKF